MSLDYAILDLLRQTHPAWRLRSDIDQVDTHINKIVELGFLRRLKPQPGPAEGLSDE